jgi:Zn-dependent protease with chaperone function
VKLRIQPASGQFFAFSLLDMIVIGEWFHLISSVEQAAIIAHETAHIHGWHQWKRIWWILSFQWKGLPEKCKLQELEADRYAVQNGHGPGLLKFLKRCRNSTSKFHPTFEERVANIHQTIGESPCL